MQYSNHLLRRHKLIIGLNIHRLRAEKRMPLRRLAARAGMPERVLDCYEIGRSDVCLHHLLKIACALEVRIAELLDNSEQENFPIAAMAIAA